MIVLKSVRYFCSCLIMFFSLGFGQGIGPSNVLPLGGSLGHCGSILLVNEVIYLDRMISLKEEIEGLYLNLPLKRTKVTLPLEEFSLLILVDTYISGNEGKYPIEVTIYSPSNQAVFAQTIDLRLNRREIDLARVIGGLTLPNMGKDIFKEPGIYQIVVTQVLDETFDQEIERRCFVGGSTWVIY